MKQRTVYLAGPIAGLTYDESQEWRGWFCKNLPAHITGLSPLRGKSQRLAREGVINGTFEDNPLTSQKGLTTRDRNDCTTSDMVIFNLVGATKVSIGTMVEIGWADANRIPMILIMEKEGNIHDHAMVRECCGFRVETKEQALEVVKAVFGAGWSQRYSTELGRYLTIDEFNAEVERRETESRKA